MCFVSAIFVYLPTRPFCRCCSVMFWETMITTLNAMVELSRMKRFWSMENIIMFDFVFLVVKEVYCHFLCLIVFSTGSHRLSLEIVKKWLLYCLFI